MRRISTPVFHALIATTMIAAALLPALASAQCTEHGACLLPRANCGYYLPGTLSYPPKTVQVRRVDLSSFTQCMAPQPPSFPIDSFFDVFVELEISGNNGTSWQPVQVTGHGHEHAVGRPDGITFDTEMLQLDLSGGSLPAGVQLRESPTQPSLGQTTITGLGGGNFHIDSFFDIFTELSIDGGATWTPSTGPGHTTVTPQTVTAVRPSTWGSLKLLYR